jgi:hypothetical protein
MFFYFLKFNFEISASKRSKTHKTKTKFEFKKKHDEKNFYRGIKRFVLYEKNFRKTIG